MENNPLMSGHIVIAYDATKDRSERDLKLAVDTIRLRGDILHGCDKLTLLGVLHRVPHPMGYQMQASPGSFAGPNISAIKDEVSKKVDLHVNLLMQSADSAEECENERVDLEVKIIAGTPIKKVVLQEVIACNATWVILDRHLRRDLSFYLKHIPSKVALIHDNLSVEVCKPYTTDTDNMEHMLVFSVSKPVPLLAAQDKENSEQSVTSCRSNWASSSSLEISEMLKNNMSSTFYRSQEQSFLSRSFSSQSFSSGDLSSMSRQEKSVGEMNKQHKNPRQQRYSDAPILCASCGMKTELNVKDFRRFSFSEIQLATNNFFEENLLGEGGYDLVYKGELKDGQLIAAKVQKEASKHGAAEFHSEVCVLSFARHKHIVMLLGYCCKENLNILVYEYICNKSLEWHLFDETENVLEWHQRYAIAIGTAKGLRFLHEECRGSPIIHRDMRPSNILLTHDFVPMLADFALAKCKTHDPVQTRILGTLGYLAPEYVENGIVSVRTDVYSFGVVLIQLISGGKVVGSEREDQQKSLRQWAEKLIQRLALHELVDPRLGASYDRYELRLMARAAYLCVQSNPELRPSIGEVVHLLEGENEKFHNLAEQFIPHFTR